jgi:hypothetical protein
VSLNDLLTSAQHLIEVSSLRLGLSQGQAAFPWPQGNI